MSWILIIFLYVGPMSDKDSVAVTSVDGFLTKVDCMTAGEAGKGLASGTTKVYRYACLPKPRGGQ